MRVRALDSDHDWTFGKGYNDYLRNQFAVIQNINTRLNSFLGDCFFATSDGVDWFRLIGGKDQTALSLAVASVILLTQDVTRLLQLSIRLDAARLLTVTYQVATVYSTSQSVFTLNLAQT